MKYVELYFVLFFIIFIIMYLLFFVLKKKKKSLGSSVGFKYLEKKYKLDMNEKRANTLQRILVFTNSIIISLPLYIYLFFIKSNGIGILLLFCLISFIIFFTLILLSYRIIGNLLKKKGW